MNFEPQKLFIGLIDFFSVIMPGAVLTYLGKDWAARYLGFGPTFPLVSTEAAFVFLFVSYLLGQFVFLFGAQLDDCIYDPLRGTTHSEQIKRLANGKHMSNRFVQCIARSSLLRLFGKKDPDAAVTQVVRLKVQALTPLSSAEAINAFQWCKMRLSKDHAVGLLTVQQFEAHSKFFRNFVVLTILAGAFFIREVLTNLADGSDIKGIWTLAPGRFGKFVMHKDVQLMLICLLALIPALWRYIDQRFKATQHAYWFILTLEAMKKPVPARTPPELKNDGLTHAGGIVFKGKEENRKVLMVQAKANPDEWVLPKGHIERDEKNKATAVREVREETGIWARITEDLQPITYHVNDQAQVVQFYLMEFAREEKPEDRFRKHEWLSITEAVTRATSAKHPETMKLLTEVAEKWKRT